MPSYRILGAHYTARSIPSLYGMALMALINVRMPTLRIWHVKSEIKEEIR